jgi:hypothetical protein
MKAGQHKNKIPRTKAETELLALVVEQLKGRQLFPERVKEAKKYLKNVKFTG